MMTHDEMIAVIQAHKDGKKVEQRRDGTVWRVMGANYAFSFTADWEYRIKPEPKVIWVNEYSEEENYIYNDQQAATEGAASYADRVAVKYIEVIDE